MNAHVHHVHAHWCTGTFMYRQVHVQVISCTSTFMYSYVHVLVLAMSNKHSFKIVSFRFAAFIPKKMEMFLISTRHFLFKSFYSDLFQKFVQTTKSFVLSLRNPGAIGNVLFLFWYHLSKIQKFCFVPERLGANKNVPNW